MWFDDGTNLGFLVLGTIIENMGAMAKVKYDDKVGNIFVYL